MRKPKIETDVRDLGWGSVESQQNRFDAIAGIGIKPTDSVLDVGCGYGDFCAHTKCKYMGIDASEERIQVARKKYPGVRFEHRNIDDGLLGIVDDYGYDYVVASGIFWEPVRGWLTNTIDAISIMDVYAIKGVAVNFLSEFALIKKPGRHYTTMTEIGQIMRLYFRCTVRRDYLPNDMTLYIYKE